MQLRNEAPLEVQKIRCSEVLVRKINHTYNMKGSVVRKRTEGYGFIKPEAGEKDVFFHASAVVDVTFDELNEGDAVTFDVEEGPKGPAATNVRKAA